MGKKTRSISHGSAYIGPYTKMNNLTRLKSLLVRAVVEIILIGYTE